MPIAPNGVEIRMTAMKPSRRSLVALLFAILIVGIGLMLAARAHRSSKQWLNFDAAPMLESLIGECAPHAANAKGLAADLEYGFVLIRMDATDALNRCLELDDKASRIDRDHKGGRRVSLIRNGDALYVLSRPANSDGSVEFQEFSKWVQERTGIAVSELLDRTVPAI